MPPSGKWVASNQVRVSSRGSGGNDHRRMATHATGLTLSHRAVRSDHLVRGCSGRRSLPEVDKVLLGLSKSLEKERGGFSSRRPSPFPHLHAGASSLARKRANQFWGGMFMFMAARPHIFICCYERKKVFLVQACISSPPFLLRVGRLVLAMGGHKVGAEASEKNHRTPNRSR